MNKSKRYLLKLIHKLNSNKQCKTYTHNFIYINVDLKQIKKFCQIQHWRITKVYLLKPRLNMFCWKCTLIFVSNIKKNILIIIKQNYKNRYYCISTKLYCIYNYCYRNKLQYNKRKVILTTCIPIWTICVVKQHFCFCK